MKKYKEFSDIDALLRYLFPLPGRLQLSGSIPQRKRALALTALLLVVAATVWFWSICLTVLYLFFDFDILFNVYYAIVVSILLALQVWGFYRFANLRFSSMFFSLSYFLMALSLMLMSGGYHSPNLVLLISSPVVSFRTGGKDEGIMNSIFVGLSGIALMVIDKMDMPIVNYLTGMDDGYFFIIAWVVTLATIATCLVTYDMDE